MGWVILIISLVVSAVFTGLLASKTKFLNKVEKVRDRWGDVISQGKRTETLGVAETFTALFCSWLVTLVYLILLVNNITPVLTITGIVLFFILAYNFIKGLIDPESKQAKLWNSWVEKPQEKQNDTVD